MSKVVNNNTDTVEQIAQTEELFNVKSATGEFIDVTDDFDDAVEVANKTEGATVSKDGSDEILYTSGAVSEPVEDVIEQVVEEPKKKEEKKPQHTKSCVQVIAVNDVIKTVEPEPEEVKSTKVVMPGMMVKLDKKPIYKSAYIPQPFKLMTGNVFIYDGNLINGRYRVVANVNNCSADINAVIGYIPENYIK